MRKLIAVVLAALLPVAIASCKGKPAQADVDEALVAQFTKQLQSVPSVDFALKDLNGKEWKLSEQKGKIVLLNFWATWCGPCQQEMPDFQKLHDRAGSEGGVAILAVSSEALEQQGGEKSLQAVSDFVKQQNFTFPVLFDADGKVWNVYQQEGVPANYILDKDGNVRLLVAGAFRDEAQLDAAIEAVRRADSGQ